MWIRDGKNSDPGQRSRNWLPFLTPNKSWRVHKSWSRVLGWKLLEVHQCYRYKDELLIHKKYRYRYRDRYRTRLLENKFFYPYFFIWEIWMPQFRLKVAISSGLWRHVSTSFIFVYRRRRSLSSSCRKQRSPASSVSSAGNPTPMPRLLVKILSAHSVEPFLSNSFFPKI